MERDDRRALYLRWRPATFAEVVGQEHVTRTLRNAVRSGKPAHAYLLCGPRGTGKTSIARILYKALNCREAQDGEPCNRCSSCRAASEGRALDLVEIDAASNRSIDDVRELREKVRFAPNEARYRVYIVDEAHELTPNAWDAFLKTLEEPPSHAIFVLATTEAHKVPATIVSRCQRFNLSRISPVALRQQLARIAAAEGVTVEPAVLERISRLARGGLRDAISLLDQLIAFCGQQVDLAAARAVLGFASQEAVRGFVAALSGRRAAEALSVLAAVADEGADLRQFAEDVLEQLRAALLLQAGAEAALAVDYSTEEIAWLRGATAGWDPSALQRAARSLAELLARTRDPLGLRLQLELAALDACNAGAPATLGAGPAAEAAPQGELAEPARATLPQRPPARPADADAARPAPAPEPAAPEPAAPLTADRVAARWQELLEAVSARLSALEASCLVNARFDGLNRAGALVVNIAELIHLQMLSRPPTRQRLEAAFSAALGQRVQLDLKRARPGSAPSVADELARDLRLRTVRRLWPDARIEALGTDPPAP